MTTAESIGHCLANSEYARSRSIHNTEEWVADAANVIVQRTDDATWMSQFWATAEEAYLVAAEVLDENS